MRVSQMLHVIDKDDPVVVDDYNKQIGQMTVYEGPARGIKRDDPINRMHILSIGAAGDVIAILAAEPREKEKK